MAVLDPDSWLVAQPFTAAADSRRKRRTPEFSGVKDSPLFMVLPMLSLLVERPLSRVSAGLRISQIHEDPEITQAPPIFPGVPRRWHWCCKAVFRARRRAGWQGGVCGALGTTGAGIHKVVTTGAPFASLSPVSQQMGVLFLHAGLSSGKGATVGSQEEAWRALVPGEAPC